MTLCDIGKDYIERANSLAEQIGSLKEKKKSQSYNERIKLNVSIFTLKAKRSHLLLTVDCLIGYGEKSEAKQ